MLFLFILILIAIIFSPLILNIVKSKELNIYVLTNRRIFFYPRKQAYIIITLSDLKKFDIVKSFGEKFFNFYSRETEVQPLFEFKITLLGRSTNKGTSIDALLSGLLNSASFNQEYLPKGVRFSRS